MSDNLNSNGEPQCLHRSRRQRQRRLADRRPSAGAGPVVVGLLGAAFAATASPDRETVVISLLVALPCYLSAALSIKWAAWAAIPIASALVVGGALIGVEPWFVLSGVAIALLIVGLVARVGSNCARLRSAQP